jgi:hypothetical protein
VFAPTRPAPSPRTNIEKSFPASPDPRGFEDFGTPHRSVGERIVRVSASDSISLAADEVGSPLQRSAGTGPEPTLWLPKQVELTWRQEDQVLGEMRLYTKYRLFNVTVNMLPHG